MEPWRSKGSHLGGLKGLGYGAVELYSVFWIPSLFVKYRDFQVLTAAKI